MITERKIQDEFFFRNQERFTTILPNCYPPRWFECDLMAITKASYMYEFEIKLSRSDYFNDANKGRSSGYLKEYYAGIGWDYGETKYQQLESGCPYGPSKFWYIVPENLILPIEIPSFAGWICFAEMNGHAFFKEIKKAPRLHKQKLSEEAKDAIRQNLYRRYWTMRRELSKRRIG